MKIKRKTNLSFLLLTMLAIFCVPNVYAAEWNLCTQSGPLKIFKIVGIALNIIKICVPLLIIIMGSIDLAKAVVSGDDKDVKESTTKLVKRFVAGIIVFFIPTIIFYVLGLVNNSSSSSAFNNCNTCVFKVSGCDAIISSAETEEKNSASEEKAAQEAANAKAQEEIDAQNSSSYSNRNYADTSNNSDSSSSSSSTSNTEYTGYIFMGDSRTVAYSGTGLIGSNDSVHAKVGGGLNDLKNTDWPALKNDLNNNKDKKYIIVYNYGVNDLGNISGYLTELKNEFSEIKTVNNNNKIILVSVNPVREGTKTTAKNSKIESFNDELKSMASSNNASYCDVNGKLSGKWDGYISNDDIHYTNDGYKAIMDIIKSC